MKFKLNNKYVRWGLTAFLVLVGGILFYYLIFHGYNIKSDFSRITSILMPVVVGMGIAYLLSPILNFIEKKVLYPVCKLLKIKDCRRKRSVLRIIGILFTAFIFIMMIYLFFFMLISQIVPSVENIINNFDTYNENFNNWINKTMEDNPEIGSYIVNTFNKYSEEFEKWIAGLIPNSMTIIRTGLVSVISFIGALWNFIIGFIISIYVLANKENFMGQGKKAIYAFFEQETANTIIKNLRFTHRTFIGFLSGKILDSIIIGILCFIGTSIIRTPYAALVSVIIGVTNVIPFFGPFLGAIPSVLLIFMVDPMHPLNCVYFIIFVVILQQIDGNIIGPKILGNSTGLSGFWVIFAITLFGGLFGVAGMIVGVPIFAVIYASIRALLNHLLSKKNLPVESKKYEKLDYVDEEGELHALITPEKKSTKQKIQDKVAQKKEEKEKQEEEDRELQEQERAEEEKHKQEQNAAKEKENADEINNDEDK